MEIERMRAAAMPRKPEKGAGSERSPSVFRLCMFAELSLCMFAELRHRDKERYHVSRHYYSLLDPKAFKDTIDLFVEGYKSKNISVVAGLDES